jgi:Carboxypeptidase regulatory-like domain
MRRLLSSSHRDASDHAGTEARPRSRRRGGAGRRALAVLVGCVALFAVGPVAAAQAGTGISGKVTEAEAPHAGIEKANVCLYSESNVLIECKTGITNAKGEYTVEGLTENHYRVGFNAAGFANQYYNDVSSLFESTLVSVTTGNVTEHIDAQLEEAGEGAVTGRVTNASNGQGAGGVEVCDESGHCVETNGNGEYTISGLSVGSHRISFSPAVTCEEEQGEKIRCQPKSNYIGQSTSVKVKANKTETLNVALRVGGQISGTVTNASITHPGLAKIEVCATRVTGPEEYGGGGCGYTSSNGQYTIDGLESGFYKVEFNGSICSIPKKGERECPEAYITQYYHGQPTFKKGETTSVTTGANTGGINETLREAFPTTPASTAAPALTGTPAVGQALSCSQGSWSHEPTYLLYQWSRNGTVITGQTGSTYTLQAADQGHSITCSVTAGNGAGAATANSNTVAIPVPLAVFAGVKVKGSVASVTLRCPGPGACSGVMKIVARVVTKHGKRKTGKVTIGVASFSMAAGKKVTLRVHLTGQGRKLLGKAGRRGLAVQITGSGLKAQAAKLKPASKRR